MSVVKQLCRLPKPSTSLLWANDGKLYLCAGSSTDKLYCGRAVYAIDPSIPGAELEWVNFGVNNDVVGLILAGDTIVVRIEDRLESQICHLDGRVLYRVAEEIEACDVAFQGQKVTVAVATSDLNHPVEVFTKVLGDSGTIQLSDLGKKLRNQQFGTANVLTFPSADKATELDALYLTPSQSRTPGEFTGSSKALPTVILVHGGPNTRLTNAFNGYYYMFVPYLLSLGYGILIPNYRGSSGRGEQWAASLTGSVGKHDYDDIITSTQHAIELGYADRDNLLLCGWSYGGFLAFCCSVRNGFHGHGWKFKAVISGAGFCDSDAMALTSDLGSVYLPEYCEGRVAWNMRCDDIHNRQASPLWEVDLASKDSKRTGEVIIPPMLIIHGEHDARCPVTQAWGMRRALQSKCLPFELVVYPRQGHVFQEQKFWIDMLLRIGKWCHVHIGGGESY
ncbi:hypothetical protein H2198_004222 [Neophaeococcomyces mojaviensis]|uniref:Uncharacterized protein n=1 Tax=Neophaeococcomyces mojaviensis TaxID=3383035 RepID=A0ACC3A987_9EURO|nr:hypothetical protein H2198_004222 [Knufia sp. JES_112]